MTWHGRIMVGARGWVPRELLGCAGIHYTYNDTNKVHQRKNSTKNLVSLVIMIRAQSAYELCYSHVIPKCLEWFKEHVNDIVFIIHSIIATVLTFHDVPVWTRYHSNLGILLHFTAYVSRKLQLKDHITVDKRQRSRVRKLATLLGEYYSDLLQNILWCESCYPHPPYCWSWLWLRSSYVQVLVRITM